MDFEAIDKEIEADVAEQATQAAAATGKDPLVPKKDGTDAPPA